MSHINLLRLYIKNIICLCEGRKEDALKKYPKLEDTIEFFAARDPSRNLKYIAWECAVVESGQALQQEVSDVIELFHKYNASLKKKDIYQYDPKSDFTVLRDELFALREKKEKREEKVEKLYSTTDAPNAPLVYESDRFAVNLIKNKSAAQSMGLGTKWCIAMKNKCYYENYIGMNVVFFFIIDKTDNDPASATRKIALSYKRGKNNEITKLEIFNALDVQLNKSQLSEFLGTENEEIMITCDHLATAQPMGISVKLFFDLPLTPDEEMKLFKSATAPVQQDDSDSISFNNRILDKLCQNVRSPGVIQMMWELPSIDNAIKINLLNNHNLPDSFANDVMTHNKINSMKNHNLPDSFINDVMTRSTLYDERIARYTKNVDIQKKFIDDHEHRDPKSRLFLAMNDYIDVDILRQLWNDSKGSQSELNKKIKNSIVTNPMIPADILRQALVDPNENIRHWAFRNKSLSREDSLKIALDERTDYISLLRLTESTTYPDVIDAIIEIMQQSTKQKLLRVIEAIAQNYSVNFANLSTSTLMILLESKKLDMYSDRAHALARHVKDDIIQLKLANEPDKSIRMNLANNQHISLKAAHVLWKTDNDLNHVRIQLTKNPAIPTDLLKVALKSKNDLIRNIAHNNPNAANV